MHEKLEEMLIGFAESTQTRFGELEGIVGTLRSDLALANREISRLHAEIAQMNDAAKLPRLQAAIDKLKGDVTVVVEPAQSTKQTETPVPTAAIISKVHDATIAVVPLGATPTTVPSDVGGDVAQPGTTLHSDGRTGIITTVPHDGSRPTAVDKSGYQAPVPPAAVAEAVDATVAAGVSVKPVLKWVS